MQVTVIAGLKIEVVTIMHKFGLPGPVTKILAWWLPEIKNCLGEKLHGVMLFGGLAVGEFSARWSDVDACAILKIPITPAEGEIIGGIHDRMRDLFIQGGHEGWESRQGIEGFYISIGLATDENMQEPCYTAGGTTRRWAVDHPVSPFDRYQLAHFGQVIDGAVVTFAPPSPEALLSQAMVDLDSLRRDDFTERSAIWLAGMLHWSASSLIFWRDGVLLGKSKALEHEIASRSPFAEAFALVLAVRNEGSALAASHHAALIEQYDKVHLNLAEEMVGWINKRQTIWGMTPNEFAIGPA